MRGAAARLTHHWVLVGTVLVVLAVGLLVASPFRAAGADLYLPQEAGSDRTVPSALRQGAVAVGRGPSGTVDALTAAPKRVALTFDDGPDPEWTARIQQVLDRHGAKATFFVVGSEVVRHPTRVRSLAADGHEIGLHTFSHINLSRAGAGRAGTELAATQLLVQAETGRSTVLVRPPFSSTPDAVDDAGWAALRRLADDGYVGVLSTVDSKDWQRPDADAVLRDIEAGDGRGQVVLLHDGGGDRSRTLAELDTLLTRLHAEGYSVGTVSETLGISSDHATVSGPRRALAVAALAGLWVCATAAKIVSWAVLVAGGIAVLRALLLLGASLRHRRELPRRAALSTSDPVTIVVPAYNEAAGIEATIRSLAASEHPVEVVVVDDGSTDDTAVIARRVAAELRGQADVRVITQANGGKPSALNTGLAATRTELVVMVDGDTVFEPGTVTALVEPFADPAVGAVSGNAKVANRGGLLGRWQHIEYVLGFSLDRRMYDLAGCMPTVPGAIGAFRTGALREVGGIGSDTLAEDTDATIALGRAGWSVRYAPDARAWTEAPASLRALWKQRYRWSYGTMQAMWKHRAGLARRGAEGRYLRRALGYMVTFQVLFPLLAPAVDLFALYALLSPDRLHAAWVWFVFLGVDLVLALVAFRSDRESPRVLWALPLTQILYRQMMYLVVIHSLATAVTGTRLRWHRMERYGTHRSAHPATA